MQYHNDTINKQKLEDSLEKYIPLNLFARFEKVVWGSTVRGSWRLNINCTILTPLLWPSALCLSRFPALHNRRPWGPALCWMMAFFTASYQQLLCAPTQSGAPNPFVMVWLSLPHIVYNAVRSLTATV